MDYLKVKFPKVHKRSAAIQFYSILTPKASAAVIVEFWDTQ